MATSATAVVNDASRSASSAGPLTAVFTAPADCTGVHAITSVLTSSNTANLGGWFRPGVLAYMPSPAYASGWLNPSAPVSVSNTCYPPNSAVHPPSAFFSPGVHCPDGWTSAMTLSSSSIRTVSNALFTPANYAQSTQASSLLASLLPHETAVLCCPDYLPNFKINPTDFLCRGYYAGTPSATLYGYGAGSTSTSAADGAGTTYSVEPTLHTIPLVPKEATSTFTVAIPFQSTAHEGAGAVTATVSVYPVQIRWRAEDRGEGSSSTGSSTAGGEPKGAATGTGGGSGATAVAVESGGGLSSGGIAGVAVGVIAGVAMIVLAAFFILRRRRRRMEEKPLPVPPDMEEGGVGAGAQVHMPELASPEKGVGHFSEDVKGPGGYYGVKYSEAPPGPDRMELDGAQRVPGVYELGDSGVAPAR
ncbi:hypothetical protein B0T16DRAFT_454698 [Cercophora newfieldiana]|uniref:Uncharacterized protein n=1 Tax=Cercophora newfieldiana TaxID=92897 RepID=A0AA39YGQ7_9PEZI|nr:hypothetical protein B0T16DRAFT_454698 [Cercophora newfieldiana]